MRTHVDLFTGIGGFSLACEWAGVQTIAFSEVDPYASRVLQRHWPNVRNYGDVRGFPSLSAWLLTAGVPCQPASVAGKRKGAADDRWLWPETLAVVENGSYEWLLFENPTGILSLNGGLEFERICASLESKGYEVQPLVIPACGVGALHRRNRIWIVAHAEREQLRTSGHAEATGTSRALESGEEEWKRIRADAGERSATVCDATGKRSYAAAFAGIHSQEESRRPRNAEPERRSADVADAARECVNGSGNAGQRRWVEPANSGGWFVEPDVGRLADGVSDRVGKLRCLGNAIVPQVAHQIIKRMIEAENVI